MPLRKASFTFLIFFLLVAFIGSLLVLQTMTVRPPSQEPPHPILHSTTSTEPPNCPPCELEEEDLPSCDSCPLVNASCPECPSCTECPPCGDAENRKMDDNDDDATPHQTHIRCLQWPDKGEVCIYRGVVCVDGTELWVVDDTKHSLESLPRRDGYDFRQWDATAPSFNPRRDVLPANSRLHARYHRSSDLKKTNVSWQEGGVYFVGFEHEVNIFFHLKSFVGPIFSVLTNNATWGGPFPPLNTVFHFRHRRIHKTAPFPWMIGVDGVLLRNRTRVVYKEDFEGTLGPQSPMCWRQAVVVGDKPCVFNGYADADVFRKLSWRAAGVTPQSVYRPRSASSVGDPPRFVTIFDRKDERRIENLDEVKAMLRRYKLDYQVIIPGSKMDFVQQVRAMAQTGVLIALHGAANANIVFMPARSALIEIFPFHLKKNTYISIAGVSGLYHLGVFSWIRPSMSKGNEEEYRTLRCHIKNSMDANQGRCGQLVKKRRVTVPIAELEVALINAFDMIGHRIYVNSDELPDVLHTVYLQGNTTHPS